MDEKQCGIIRSTDREKIKNGRNNFFFFWGGGINFVSNNPLPLYCNASRFGLPRRGMMMTL
jgi:hypothetical protein